MVCVKDALAECYRYSRYTFAELHGLYRRPREAGGHSGSRELGSPADYKRSRYVVKAILLILGFVLELFLRWQKQAPERERKENYDEFKKALANGDTTNASILLRDNFRRVLSSKGSRAAKQ